MDRLIVGACTSFVVAAWIIILLPIVLACEVGQAFLED